MKDSARLVMSSFGLRFGERKQWCAGGETAGTLLERNAAAVPQTEAPPILRRVNYRS
jgi:hypothetical protein